jgi:hypothetical protein
MDLVGVLAGLSGAVLVWAALKNKQPIKAVQLALTGGDPNAAPPFTAATDAPTAAGSDSTAAPQTTPPGGEATQPGGAPLELPQPWGTI